MKTIQLDMQEDISQKVIDFLLLLPRDSVTIHLSLLDEDAIRKNISCAENDIANNKFHTLESAREQLLSGLKR